jgi:hypothetical protein
MKNKMLIGLFSLGLLAYSCGEATPEVDEALVEETLQLQNEIDVINEEIEELNIADADLEDALNDLGDLIEK